MVVCFYCYHCGLEEGDLIKSFPTKEVKIKRVPCTGRIDNLALLHALEQGAEQVFVFGCPEGECHNLTGSKKAKARIEYLKKVLIELGLKEDRVRFISVPRTISPKKGDFYDCGREEAD